MTYETRKVIRNELRKLDREDAKKKAAIRGALKTMRATRARLSA